MLTKPIPSTHEQLPVIGLGTWQTFDVDRTKHLEEVLSLFVELGGRLVDSSPMYGRAEKVVGDLATSLALRNQLFIATKVWTRGKREGIAQMESSEEKLRGRVDLMQVHNVVDADAHLETLRAWKAEGRVRYIGVTHYTSSGYAALETFMRRPGIDFVQLNYSIAEREAERRLLPLALELGIAVLVNRPFGEGAILRQTQTRALPAFASELDATSWAELLLKFVVSHPAVTCAIPATSNAAHLRDNMRAGEGRMPDEAMRKKIAAALLE
ncbi:MAG: aldo/keto reductase [Acidobacteriota bacterium]|nr:aldo/keto reductase [Acidobacteriota bacterium]